MATLAKYRLLGLKKFSTFDQEWIQGEANVAVVSGPTFESFRI